MEKTRYTTHVGPHTALIDVFDGALDGLRLVEVEFTSQDEMMTFDPPDWFGIEVTDDPRFSNASLAVHGWPPDAADSPSDEMFGAPAPEQAGDPP